MKRNDDETAYDGRRFDKMAPYAHKLGEANVRRDSCWQRILTSSDRWWKNHPRTRQFVMVLFVVIMVGAFLNHWKMFP